MARPGPTDDQIRLPVEPGTGEHVEVLTWSFPRVSAAGVTLTLAWGSTRVPLEIGVERSFTTTVAADVAGPYVGEWTMEIEGVGVDAVPFEVSYTGEELRAQTIFPNPDGELEELELLLLPRADWVPGGT